MVALLISTFLLNVPPNRNFYDAITVQHFIGIYVWNFVQCFPPNQNPGIVTGTTSTLCRAYYTKITLLNNLIGNELIVFSAVKDDCKRKNNIGDISTKQTSSGDKMNIDQLNLY